MRFGAGTSLEARVSIGPPRWAASMGCLDGAAAIGRHEGPTSDLPFV